jgi:nicotinamidase-related amidase
MSPEAVTERNPGDASRGSGAFIAPENPDCRPYVTLFGWRREMETLRLSLRCRNETPQGGGDYSVEHRDAGWEADKTAVIVCDMWERHWCEGATRRVAELAPIMEELLRAARARGVFIIHAPSGTMPFYEGTTARTRAQRAPAFPAPPSLRDWQPLDPAKEPPLPIDDSDGGCDDVPPCPHGAPWTRQHPAIRIADEDAVSDDGAEVYNLLQERGIENVIVMGVHTNMCVLGRPFSIRQMVRLGKNVALARDMTDTMYNSRRPPYVSHFRGTDLVVEHIEKHWCPTLTSDQITGGRPFRFHADRAGMEPESGPP